MRISLCLLTWNELAGCCRDVPLLDRGAFEEVYAVDAGSTDGTVEYLASEGIPVHRQPRKGLNAAYHHAIDVSTCDAVVFFFPKGTVPTADLLRFRPLFESGFQMVVASRNLPGARNEEDGRLLRPRKWGVGALSLFASLVWRREGHRVRDVLHGIRGFTVEAFRRMDPGDTGLSIDLETVVRSYRRRVPRCEFPTTESPRLEGESHFKLLPTAARLASYLLREMRRPAGEEDACRT